MVQQFPVSSDSRKPEMSSSIMGLDCTFSPEVQGHLGFRAGHPTGEVDLWNCVFWLHTLTPTR